MTKKKNTEPWFCLNCGDDISHMRSDAKYCWKTECRNAYAVNKYSKRLTEKICNYCGKSFLGKDKAVNCDNCWKLRKTINFQRYEQKTVCRHCGKILNKIEKNVTRAVVKTILSCCRDCNSKNHSILKLGDKNPNWKGGIPKRSNKYQNKDDMSRDFSIRMKSKNPMHDPLTAQKVGAVIMEKYKLGMISKKFGPNHWLWKGNRKHSFVLRTRLNIWHADVLARDHYTCQNCGSKKHLEVHHINETFAEIVKAVMIRFGIISLSEVDTSSQLFEDIASEVISRHTIAHGITYCKECHAIIDSKRRI